jgi:hypothetical protein
MLDLATHHRFCEIAAAALAQWGYRLQARRRSKSRAGNETDFKELCTRGEVSAEERATTIRQ